MDNLDTDFLVAQQLKAFEDLEPFSVSKEWEANLDMKLQQVKRSSDSYGRYQLVLGLLTLMNIGFILFAVSKKQDNSTSRVQDLKVITSELLIPEKN